MRAEGTQEALEVVENLEGRKKGNLEAAEKTNMDFYNFHQILIVFTHRRIKALFHIFTSIGQAQTRHTS